MLFLLLYRLRTKRNRASLTTNAIADELDSLEGESFDDSDADKDYEVEKDASSSSSSPADTSDDENHVITAIKASKKREEVRVYMDPPVEKADGDSDKDSGGQTFCSCAKNYFFQFVMPFLHNNNFHIQKKYKYIFLFFTFI